MRVAVYRVSRSSLENYTVKISNGNACRSRRISVLKRAMDCTTPIPDTTTNLQGPSDLELQPYETMRYPQSGHIDVNCIFLQDQSCNPASCCCFSATAQSLAENLAGKWRTTLTISTLYYMHCHYCGSAGPRWTSFDIWSRLSRPCREPRQRTNEALGSREWALSNAEQ